jgi:hypothetical protein
MFGLVLRYLLVLVLVLPFLAQLLMVWGSYLVFALVLVFEFQSQLV